MTAGLTDAQLAAILKHPEAVLEELDRIDGEESLRRFVRILWPVLEPEQPFRDSWALGAICEHLSAVTSGEIRRLLMNVPPGFTKSLTTDVFWPAWEWGPRNMPHMRYVCASYSHALTIRDNMRFQRLVESDRYRRLWGDRWKKDDRQWEKIKCANDKTGWKIATSVGGIGTGERGNRFIIDDPNSVQEAESDAIRNTTNTWFREVVPDRLNDLKNDAILVIQQRTHGEDVSAVAMDLGYVHLMIPMEYDPARHCVTVIDWEDPRTVEGDLAEPERFPPAQVAELKRAKGPYAYAAQYDQAPVPRGGGIIKRDWWQVWPPEDQEQQWLRAFLPDGRRWQPGTDTRGLPYQGPEPEGVVWKLSVPQMSFVCASLDTAYTEKEENDYSALTIWGVFALNEQPKVMLLDAWKERLEFHDLVTKVLATCRKRKIDALLVEAKASGLSVIQEVTRLMRPEEWAVWPVTPDGDKVARMHSVVPLFNGAVVFAPDRQWAENVIDDVTVFPRGASRDVADTVSQALRWLRTQGLIALGPEAAASTEAEQALAAISQQSNSGLGDDVLGGF